MSDLTLHSVLQNDEAFTTLMTYYEEPRVSGPLRLKLDTGSGGNTLPLRTYKQMFGDIPISEILTPEPNVRLTSYSDNEIRCVGSIQLKIKTAKQNDFSTEKFYVVDVPGPAILGLPTCRSLKLIHINSVDKNAEAQPAVTTINAKKEQPLHTPPPGIRINSIDELKKWFPDCFDGIGCFSGEEELHLKPDAIAHIDAPRRCAIHLKDKVRDELDKMEELGVINKITHHTDWCSSMTCTTKKDGSLRLCLDPQRLNQALKRCPHKIPTVEEVTPAFNNAKYITKLDAKAGYWSIKLKQAAQELTTFRTPFGRYCFTRLPFGLCVSQDLFQQHMDRIISRCEGCVGISDDIAIVGSSEEEHDRRLIAFLNVARDEGLMLNSAKCTIKSNRITFFGRVYSDKGVSPDPAKVEDIVNMPNPQDKQDIQRFMGMVTFLSTHIPNLSSHTAALRDLIKKDSVFVWEESHQRAFDDLKNLVASNISLKYFNPSVETTIEVDASMKGLGATLIQNGAPVAFASKALTQTQANYSNIERECLAVIYGIQRFHTYVYGKHFTVTSDHKPLEMIFKKPIHRAPPRLQRMIIKVLGYDFDVQYQKGSTVILADALSRAPNPSKNQEVELDINVDSIITTKLDLMNFSNDKQAQIREETSRDPVMRELLQTIYTGWPNHIQQLPTSLREYWNYRDELAIESGIIFKGKQVLIPTPLRADILTQLHYGHQGIEKTRHLARETVYWPRINKDVETLCKSCDLCQEMQPKQAKEPLHMHEKPSEPWIKLGTDLFQINERNYLIIADYFSRYPVIKELSSTTAASVIKATKETISLFGCPREIVSDNGPQYLNEYDQFCSEWGITHTTSSPRHPQSNGFIERQIRYLKPIIRKCIKTGSDLNLAMINVRATPLDNIMPSPAELLFKRQLSTVLPLRQTTTTPQVYKDHLTQASNNQKRYADTHCRELPPLINNQNVRVWDGRYNKWSPAKVINKHSDRSYIIETENNRLLRRNRRQLREVEIDKQVTFKDSNPHEPATTTQTENNTQTPATPTSILKKPVNQQPNTTRSGRVVRIPERYKDNAQ